MSFNLGTCGPPPSSAGSFETQRAELRQASDTAAIEDAEAARVVSLDSLAAGVPDANVTLDRDHRRATAIAVPLAGAGPDAFRILEQRASVAAKDWQVTIVPPPDRLPTIRFADNVDTLDSAARDAVLLSVWEAQRWNIPALAVPGLPDGDTPPAKPTLNERRALNIAMLIRANHLRASSAPAGGQVVTLKAAAE